LFTVNFLYGVNYVVAKGLMPGVIHPSGFILLRVIGAGALFWLLRAVRPQRVNTADLGRLLLCAFFGVALNQLMFFHGLMRTSPLNASIIMVATPILVLVMAGIVLKERITWTRLGGVLLGAGGALALILLKPSGDHSGATALGDLAILVNATSYAVFLVIVKPLMRRYRAVTVMAWCFLFALPMVLPFGYADVVAMQWSALTTAHWMALAFVVVMVTFVAYLLNTWALAKVSPMVVGTYIYMQPVLAAVFTWLFVQLGPERLGISGAYDATLHFPQLLCAAAIFLGVYLVGKADAGSEKGGV
jgi:drug/metabolite transporter (DMT)-like permease